MTARRVPDGQIAPPERTAAGSTDGTPRLTVGQRVVVTYQHWHERPGVMETRHAFGRVAHVYDDGRVAVATDRGDGFVCADEADVEVVA